VSVSQRKDGRWLVKYKTRDGWRQRSFPKSQEAAARQFDEEWQYDQQDNTRPTLFEVVAIYLKNQQFSERTIEKFEYLIAGYDRRRDGKHTLGPAEHLADRYADTLTRRDLETFREVCRERGMSASTINHYTAKIKAALSWCAEQGIIVENPWAKYRMLPAKPGSLTGTLEDFQKVYAVLPPWMQWACRTTIALCLRPGMGELFSLKWSAFDWRQKIVNVYMPKTRATKIVYPPQPYLDEAWGRYQKDAARGEVFVCRNKKGREVITSGCWDTAWRRACEKVGVRMTPYAMRHIAASEMLANGADLAAVAAQLGHKNISTTASYYTHALTRAQRNAGALLPTCTNLVSFGADSTAKPLEQ